jgi:hypothetical protein
MQGEVPDLRPLHELLKAMGWRTSARNQFRGTIKSVRSSGVTGNVTLDIGDDLDITATVTVCSSSPSARCYRSNGFNK